MNRFNDTGISRQADRARMGHLFRVGLFGAPLAAMGKAKTT